MLHPLNPPSCSAQLLRLVAYQGQMLRYASSQSNHDDKEFSAALGSELGQWLLEREKTDPKDVRGVRKFFNDLPLLIKQPDADKAAALDDFLADQDYDAHFEERDFEFAFRSDKSEAHAYAAKCLIAFFEFLGGTGYPDQVIGGTGLSKRDVVAGYKDTNPGIKQICPCCDGPFVDTSNANPEGYTLEHYFPKAVYSAICLHPLNMIPMCNPCNARKGDKDPLFPIRSASSSQVPFDEVFHPVKRPVRKHAELRFLGAIRGWEDLRFVSLSGKPMYEAIASYDELYQIPERWRTLWERVDFRVELKVSAARRWMKFQGRGWDEDALADAIDFALEELSDHLGAEQFAYPAMQWLRWARENRMDDLKRAYLVP